MSPWGMQHDTQHADSALGLTCANKDLQQSWPLPAVPKPIMLIGAGGIAKDAHLPAYKQAGFKVKGVFDIVAERAKALAEAWGIEMVFNSLSEMIKEGGVDVVYDLATPPNVIAGILAILPEDAAVLMQKPMGQDLATASCIQRVVHDRHLKAAVNFQLRFSPVMLATADIIRRGLLGRLLEIDAQVKIFQPWHLFPFLKGADRVEILYHSIHYLDFIRALAGDPAGVFCRTMGDPRSADVSQTRTSAMLDYGSDLRVILSVNHNHRFGRDHQIAKFRLEGTKGCLIVKLGVLYDYPQGEPDELLYCPDGGAWESIDLTGTWFPDAFIGTMSNVQRFDSGEDDELVSSVDDALKTMALAEACYEANGLSGVRPKVN